MNILRLTLLFTFCMWSIALAQDSPLSYKGKGLTLTLLKTHKTIQPGHTLTVGLHIEHEEGYHTYWKNPGIIGLPVTLKWDLPNGIKEQETLYPYPEKSTMAIYPCYGYKRPVTLLSPLHISPDYKGKEIHAELQITWICCAEACCPDTHTFKVQLPVAQISEIDTTGKKIIDQARKEIPSSNPEVNAILLSKVNSKQITLSLHIPPTETPLHLYSEDNQSSSDVEQIFQQEQTGRYIINLERYKYSPLDQNHFPAVLQTNSNYYKISPAYH